MSREQHDDTLNAGAPKPKVAATPKTVVLAEPIPQDSEMPNAAQVSPDGPDKTSPQPQSPTTVSGTDAMPEGDTSMHPTAPSTMTPKEPHACPDGQHWDATAGACMPNTDLAGEEYNCPDGEHWDAAQGKCVSTDLTQEQECEDGMHWDAEQGKCVSDSDTEERVKRWKAEDRAKTAEGKALSWESRYVNEHQRAEQLKGALAEVKTAHRQSEERKEQALREMHNANVERDKYKRLRDEAAGERDDTTQAYEKLQREHRILREKYDQSLQTNLSLSKKCTQAQEDFLDKAKENELLKEKLTRTRNLAKKTLKIKV
jgi:hypothetical protein